MIKVAIDRLAVLAMLAALAALTAPASYAQHPFPRNEREDTAGVMSHAYWAYWNDEVNARIDRDIEANRKADAVISVGKVKRGTTVEVEQISHDFIFGAHIFNFNQLATAEANARYRDLWGPLFNRATVAFYWKVFETEPGRCRFGTKFWDTEEFWTAQPNPKSMPHWRRPSTDQIIDFLEQRGVPVHGHPLVWGNRKWQWPHWIYTDCMTPEEKARLDSLVVSYRSLDNGGDCDLLSEAYNALPVEDLERMFPRLADTLDVLINRRITRIAEHYGSRIGSWDVVNESAVDFARGKMVPDSRLCKSFYGVMPGDYTMKGFRTAAEAFSEDVKLNINDYWSGPEYARQVRDLLDRGARIDVVGSQMHLFKPQQMLDIAAGADNKTPQEIWALMEDLGSTGLPLVLSEITITSPGDDLRSQQIQATVAWNLYRIWFSTKEMTGITWWNTVDGCGAPGEPARSGIFTYDMQPKIAYYALNSLINDEWKTSLQLKPDSRGRISFRGFRGTYRIRWTDPSGVRHEMEHVVR